jgi:hypothetical protein
MDGRATWQALQARLTAARVAVAAGDPARALAEINAALDIDPGFLAAHSLRDGILAPAASPAATAKPPSEPGLVSADGYAMFEQRAKRRRIDRRLNAAHAALNDRRLKAAAAALGEVVELDPTLPELRALTAELDDLRGTSAAVRRGPRLAAAAVFATTALGASWLTESTWLISRPTMALSPLVAAPMPAATRSRFSEAAAVGSAGKRPPAHTVAAELPGLRAVVALPQAADPGNPMVGRPLPPSEPAAVTAMRAASFDASPALAPVAIPALGPVAKLTVDDDVLVKQTLQRYRSAYGGLDARSAQAVWPAVNQAALARAFDGLASQTLTFDACDVRVRGESASATCQGSARYVPRVGSREPRVEPRVWNFTLKKTDAGWKIDHATARAER